MKFQVLVLALACTISSSANAQVFDVDTTIDAPDSSPGDGVCASIEGECTLRAAVMEANALPGFQGARLPAGTYVVDVPWEPYEQPDQGDAASGDLDITDEFRLEGAGLGLVLITSPYSIPTLFEVRAPTLITDVSIGGEVGRRLYVLSGLVRTTSNLELLRVSLSDCISDLNSGVLVGDGGALVMRHSEMRRNNGEPFGVVVSWYGSALIERSEISDNHGGSGALQVGAGSEMTIDGSRITDNTSGNSPIVSGVGTLVIRDTVMAGNSAYGGVIGSVYSSFGAGSRLENATISGNRSGIFGAVVAVGSDFAIESSSIIDNRADTLDPFPIVQGGVVRSSIIANGSTVDCLDVISAGNNLFGTACQNSSLQPSDLMGSLELPLDPLVGTLSDNGGPTSTHALLPGSPAIGSIPVADCTAFDQRGVARPRGAACDIGAFEVTVCQDGLDNDGDGLVDAADPACRAGTSTAEKTRCDDDLDNDADGAIDWDGGVAGASPDPACADAPWRTTEASTGCGLGAELAAALGLLLRRGSRSRR